MLITLFAMQSIWFAWREYQLRRSFRAGGVREADAMPPFWSALLARYRRELTVSRGRRARTRRAIERINTVSERKLRARARR